MHQDVKWTIITHKSIRDKKDPTKDRWRFTCEVVRAEGVSREELFAEQIGDPHAIDLYSALHPGKDFHGIPERKPTRKGKTKAASELEHATQQKKKKKSGRSCTHCSAVLLSSQKFCGQCGVKAQGNSNEEAVADSHSVLSSTSREKKKGSDDESCDTLSDAEMDIETTYNTRSHDKQQKSASNKKKRKT